MNALSRHTLDTLLVRAVEALFDAAGLCAVYTGPLQPGPVRSRTSANLQTVRSRTPLNVRAAARSPTVAAVIGLSGAFCATLTVATTPDLLPMAAGVALHDQAVRDRASELASALAAYLRSALARWGVAIAPAPPVTLEGYELSFGGADHVFAVRGIPLSIRLDVEPPAKDSWGIA